ncbi:hypothetical protein KBI23_27140 [bacterium]|nr:hypothetical protein [bacterium]MBP9811094.1 hypothetical protein [bacterium]
MKSLTISPPFSGLGSFEKLSNGKTDGSSLNRLETRKVKLAKAQGKFKLKYYPGETISFVPGPALVRNPDLISSIPPDNIFGFEFSFNSVDDSEDAVADRLVAKLSRFNNLHSICLNRCDVTDSGITGLRNLPQLQSLDLGHTFITGASLAVICKLTGLRELSLNSDNLGGANFAHFSRLPELVFLNLTGAEIDDAMVSKLSSCKNLRILILSRNSKVTNASLSTFASMGKLEILEIVDTSIDVRNLKLLSRLKCIVVSERDLKGSSVEQLKKIAPCLVVDGSTNSKTRSTKPGKEELYLFAPYRK